MCCYNYIQWPSIWWVRAKLRLVPRSWPRLDLAVCNRWCIVLYCIYSWTSKPTFRISAGVKPVVFHIFDHFDGLNSSDQQAVSVHVSSSGAGSGPFRVKTTMLGLDSRHADGFGFRCPRTLFNIDPCANIHILPFMLLNNILSITLLYHVNISTAQGGGGSFQR